MAEMLISVVGRLGNDPHQVGTTTGTPMVRAPLAIEVPLAGKDAGTTTPWWNLVAFARQAEQLSHHTQGELVQAFGRVQVNRWTEYGFMSSDFEGLKMVANYIQAPMGALLGYYFGVKSEQKDQTGPDGAT